MKLRHAVAPLFVVSLIVLALASLLWVPAVFLLAAELFFYLAAAVLAGLHAVSRLDGPKGKVIVLMPLVFANIHVAWGVSFLLRLITPKRANRIEVVHQT
jgi:hypothetical protein